MTKEQLQAELTTSRATCARLEEERDMKERERAVQHRTASDLTGENMHLRKRVEKAEAQVATLTAALRRYEWQPIATAPQDGAYLLLVSSAHGRVIGAHVAGDAWHLIGVGVVTSESQRPTHWMPLPDPPAVLRAASEEA